MSIFLSEERRRKRRKREKKEKKERKKREKGGRPCGNGFFPDPEPSAAGAGHFPAQGGHAAGHLPGAFEPL